MLNTTTQRAIDETIRNAYYRASIIVQSYLYLADSEIHYILLNIEKTHVDRLYLVSLGYDYNPDAYTVESVTTACNIILDELNTTCYDTVKAYDDIIATVQ